MTLLKFLRRRRAQQLADAQADLAIARQDAERLRLALAAALLLADGSGSNAPERWRRWWRDTWIASTDNRSAVEIIDEAIGADEEEISDDDSN